MFGGKEKNVVFFISILWLFTFFNLKPKFTRSQYNDSLTVIIDIYVFFLSDNSTVFIFDFHKSNFKLDRQ